MVSRVFLNFTAAAYALGLTLGVAPAVAAPKLQGIGEASLGYTDNVQIAADTPQTGDTTRSGAAFLMLSPGVVLASESQGNLHRLGYRYEHQLFFGESDTSGSSHRLDYRSFFELSRRLSLVLGASVTESNRFGALIIAPPGAVELAAVPIGTSSFLQGTADGTVNFEFARDWRAWQGVSALAETPIFGTDAPQTTGMGARTGVERTFLIDAVGVEARGDYTVVNDGVAVDGLPIETQRQLVAGGVALWRHDWGRFFTSNAEAGALRVQRLNTGRGAWYPVGAASLAYINEFGDAQLSYTHTITTNALLGQSLLIDEIRLRGAIPLTDKGDVVLAATAGYQRGQLLDENASLAAHVDVLQGDLMLGWQTTDLLLLGARYQHIRQTSDAVTPPLPLSFVQNNFLVGATVKLPPDRDMPRAYRAGRRVDGSDEIRDDGNDGGEPMYNGPSGPGI